MHVCVLILTLVSMQGDLGDGDLMLICITPDHEGKFGFNVKVGICLTLFLCLQPTAHTAKCKDVLC